MSRQLTCFEWEIGFQQMREREDGLFEMVKTPVTTVEDSSMTKTQARAAIKDAGENCPRNCNVYWDKKSKVVYFFTTEALKKVAEEVKHFTLDGTEITD